MANNTVLADSIAHIPDFNAWDKLFAARITDFDLTPLLVYMVDNVDSSALPFLAQQFSLTGFNGYKLAQNDEQRRELIRQAIELHKYKGTIWSLKEAMKSIGMGELEVQEGVSGDWARFSINVDINQRKLNAAEVLDLLGMINTYKPARCTLDGITYRLVFDDDVNLFEEVGASIAEPQEDLLYAGVARFYDGSFIYNGEADHSPDTDILTVTKTTL